MKEKTSKSILESVLTELRGNSPRERLLHRLHGVTLVLSGLSASEVARIYGDSPRAVSYWVARFKAAGIDGLHDEVRSGRPARLNQSHMKKLQTVLNKSAGMLKKEQGGILLKYISKEFGITLNMRQCLRIVNRLTT
jgi:transposase